MCSITFQDVLCRGLTNLESKYRLVLFPAGSNSGKLKSAYEKGASAVVWNNPFSKPLILLHADPSPHPSINVHLEARSGIFGRHKHSLCSYVLPLVADCDSKTFELTAIERGSTSLPKLSATITVTGIGVPDNSIVSQTPLPSSSTTVSPLPPPRDSTQDVSKPLTASTGSTGDLQAPEANLSFPPITPLRPPVASLLPSHDNGISITGALSNTLASSILPSVSAMEGDVRDLLVSAQDGAEDAARARAKVRSRPVPQSELMANTPGSAVEGTGDAAWSGVSEISGLIEIVNIASDIHPLVKGVWSLLNVAYTLAKRQADIDDKVTKLVQAIDASCALARALAKNTISGDVEHILKSLLREVLNGATIVKEYCVRRESRVSAVRLVGSAIPPQVDTCLETLDIFRRNLTDNIAANIQHDLSGLISRTLTELTAQNVKLGRIDDYVQSKADEALLKQMPFAPEADRALRSRERGCLPNTRVEIIDAIVNWAIGADGGASQSYIKGLHRDSRVLWLCGVAGSGKSSIAISVARALRSMDRLAALYGFEKAFQTSLNTTNLFSTVSRQRAGRRPEHTRHLIQKLRQMQPEMRATTDAGEQFKSFMATALAEDSSAANDVVVIDAFDESGSIASRSTALQALSSESSTTFPKGVRFIVTSRYDPDIARRLESATGRAPSFISVFQMEDIHPPHTERDIELYVFHMLRDVEGLEASRAAGRLAQLAVTAEHSFQWASMSCRYIRDEDDHDGLQLPADRLEETLATRGGLDDMYLSILDRSFGDGTSKESDGTRSLAMILGCLICAEEPVSVHIIAALAAADPSTHTVDEPKFHLLARKLSSIITGTKNTTTPLVAFHTSFTDFLADNKRSKTYAVRAPDMHLHLALASLAVMRKSLRFNICCLETSFLRNNQVPDLAERIRKHIPDELSYACHFWPLHAAFAFSSASVDSGDLRESFSAFLEDKLLLLEWLEVMSLTGTDAYESLSPLSSLQTNYRALSDLITFIAYFTVPIFTSVPHIYLSALAFTPSSSSVTSALADFPNVVQSSVPLVSWPQIRHTFAHQSEVHCVTFSSNGKWVLSGAESGEISVWDVYSGRLILPRLFGSSRVFSMAISGDGSLLASGFKDGNIQLWDLGTMSASREPLQGHTDEVDSVAFSPDGALLASGSDDKTVRLWAVSSRSQVGSPLLGHSGNVLSVAFSPSGDILASGGGGTIRLWNVRTASAASAARTPLEGRKSIWPVVFSPNGTLLASGEGDGTVRLWDANTMSALEPPITAHTSSVRSLSFSPDSKLLASCSRDRTIRVWDMTTQSQVGEPLVGHTGDVVSIAFSPDGTLLASGSADKTIHIWDVRDLASNRDSSAMQFKIQNFAAFSRDGKLLASGSDDNAIQLWDVQSVSAVREPLKGHAGAIDSVAFSPEGTLLASGSGDKTVRLWDVCTGLAVGEPLRGHSDRVYALAFSADSKLLASASFDGTIQLWDTHDRSASGDPLTGVTGPSEYVLSIAFSHNGSTLASGDAGGTVRLWDVTTRSPIGQSLKGHSNWVRCVAFAPDGTLLASGSDDGTVRLWDVHTQSAVGELLKGHTNYVYSLVFSHDGALLASESSGENAIHMWDVRAPFEVKEPVALLRHEFAIFSSAFLSAAPILSSISSIAGGGVVREWDLEYLLSASSSNFPRNPEERLNEHTSSRLPENPDLSALPPDFPLNLDDGWVIGPNKELVLWIPPALRPSIDDIRVKARSGGPPLVKLNFSNFVCGSDWTKCLSPPPVSSSDS